MDIEFSKKLIHQMTRFVYLSNSRLAMKGIAKASDPMETLTAAQQQFIIKLGNEGSVQISKIAEYFMLKRPNATRFANELIRLGWCEKKRQGDKRFVYLVLSDEGKRRLKEKAQIAVSYYMELLNEHISDTEQKNMLEFYLYVNELLEKIPL